MKITKKLSLYASLGLLGLALSTSAGAIEKGHIKLTSVVNKEITVTDQNGQKKIKLIPAKKVLPGDILQYVTSFKNISNKMADNIGITNPIPANTHYLPNTATGNEFTISYSIDGGKHWAQPAQLKKRDQQGQWQLASAKDYTHIRWTYNGNLAPQEQKIISFNVQLL